MTPKTYYIITNLDNNIETLVNTIESIEETTGIEKRIFKGMKPGQVYIIDNWQVICDETQPKDVTYYKNLWNLWR